MCIRDRGSIGSQMGFANRDKYGDIISDEIEKYIKNGVAKEKREKKLVAEHLVKEIKVERTLQYGGSKLDVYKRQDIERERSFSP